MTWQEWKFRWQMRRQRRRQRRYDKAFEKCRKAAERDGIPFDRLWAVYDPANAEGNWKFYGVFVGGPAITTLLLAAFVEYGWDGELPWILQDIYDFFASAAGVVVAAIAFPAVLYGG